MIREIDKNYFKESKKLFTNLKENVKLSEGGFLTNALLRGLTIISMQIKKHTGLKTYLIRSFYTYKTAEGLFKGFTILLGNRREIRFNLRVGKNNTNSIESVDFFISNPNKADFTINIMKGFNILQVLNLIISTIKNPMAMVKELQESDMMNKKGKILEKAITKEQDFKDWVIAKGLTDDYIVNTKKLTLFNDYSYWAKDNDKTVVSLPTFNLVMKDYLSSKSLTHTFDRVRITKSKPFIILPNKEDTELVNYIKNNEKLDDLEDSLEELKLDIKVLNSRLTKDGKNLLIA